MLSVGEEASFFSSSQGYSTVMEPMETAHVLAPKTSFVYPGAGTILSEAPLSTVSTGESFPSQLLSPAPMGVRCPPYSMTVL